MNPVPQLSENMFPGYDVSSTGNAMQELELCFFIMLGHFGRPSLLMSWCQVRRQDTSNHHDDSVTVALVSHDILRVLVNRFEKYRLIGESKAGVCYVCDQQLAYRWRASLDSKVHGAKMGPIWGQ